VQLVKLVDDSNTVAPVAEPQRSPARERLAAVLDVIAQRQAEVTEAAKPVHRLEAVIKGHSSARWRLDLARGCGVTWGGASARWYARHWRVVYERS
jgi:hypothetical protein